MNHDADFSKDTIREVLAEGGSVFGAVDDLFNLHGVDLAYLLAMVEQLKKGFESTQKRKERGNLGSAMRKMRKGDALNKYEKRALSDFNDYAFKVLVK